MAHPPALIAKIMKLIEIDYPPSLYRYSVERAIPGSRMHPDILVFAGSGKMMCAVEIGYTRPEKLTAYRKVHRIPDVRWYDKSGVLHADVEEKSVALTVTTNIAGMFSVYRVVDEIPCPDCMEEGDANLGDDADLEALEEIWTASAAYVDTTIVTDFQFAWFPSFCDKCALTWMVPAEEAECTPVYCALQDNSGDFGRIYGGRIARLPWRAAADLAYRDHGLTLEFENVVSLAPGSSGMKLQADISRVRDAERKGAPASPRDAR